LNGLIFSCFSSVSKPCWWKKMKANRDCRFMHLHQEMKRNASASTRLVKSRNELICRFFTLNGLIFSRFSSVLKPCWWKKMKANRDYISMHLHQEIGASVEGLNIHQEIHLSGIRVCANFRCQQPRWYVCWMWRFRGCIQSALMLSREVRW
jgi:hypothetical protein